MSNTLIVCSWMYRPCKWMVLEARGCASELGFESICICFPLSLSQSQGYQGIWWWKVDFAPLCPIISASSEMTLQGVVSIKCLRTSSFWNMKEPLHSKVQLILISHPLHTCKLAYSLKFICKPQINTCGTSVVTCRRGENGKILSHSMHAHPAAFEQGDALPSHFSSPTVSSLLGHIIFCIFVRGVFCVILLFNMAKSLVLKCCLVSLSTAKLWCGLQRKNACWI